MQWPIFDCSPCSNKHLNDMLNSYGFRKNAEGKYLSKYIWKTELEVLHNAESKECLTLVFRYVDKSKKDYKVIFNALSEK